MLPPGMCDATEDANSKRSRGIAPPAKTIRLSICTKGNDMKLINQKGQALVELAISLPLLVLLVFGVTEFGRVMYIRNSLNYAARLGARTASISNPINATTITTSVIASIPASLQPGVSVSVTTSASPPVHGTSTVTVAVTKPFTTVVPILIPGLSGITLSGQASMLYE